MKSSTHRRQEARDWLAKAFELATAPDKLKLRPLEQAELDEVWRAE